VRGLKTQIFISHWIYKIFGLFLFQDKNVQTVGTSNPLNYLLKLKPQQQTLLIVASPILCYAKVSENKILSK
jgi:hypothetical protein